MKSRALPISRVWIASILLSFAIHHGSAQFSSLVFPGAGGRLQYAPYANWGQSNAVNVVPDFSFAGYMGGGVAIPSVSVVETVLPPAGDATGLIQGALDRVSALPIDANGFRGAVLLKAGRYEVGSPLIIRASGVVLRGEGQMTAATGGTELVATSPTQHTLIQLKGNETSGSSIDEPIMETKLYPVQYTWLAFNVTSGVAEELDGDRTVSFHVFTDANQYTNYASRENTLNQPPTLELTVTSSVPGIDTVVAVSVVADTYVRGGVDSLNNFGGESSLAVKFSGVGAANTREAYLKFDLSAVVGSLKQAVLKLYAIYDLTQPTVTIPVLSHTVSLVKDDSWGERTLTYATRPRSGTSGVIRRITSAYVPTGARTFEVESTAGLAVGDTIEVVRTPNDAWITALEMAQYGWTASAYRISYERVLEGVVGNSITINVPIVQAMEPAYGGGEVVSVAARGRLRNCGVEGLMLTSLYASDVDESHGWIAIGLSQTTDCWVRKVTAQYFGYSCVFLGGAHRTTVEECAMLDPKSITTGGRKYPFNIDKGSLNLFQRCYARGGRHDFVTGSRVAGPNVFVDCASVETYADIGPHHRYATGVLFDNIRGGEIRVQNRKDMGSGHGWAGAQTMFWNCQSDAGEFKVESPVGAMNWGIGCVGLLQSGAGFWESWGSRILPRSLYFQQLQDRLGLGAVVSVTLPEQRSAPIWDHLIRWAGIGELSDVVHVDDGEEGSPQSYMLGQNYPNPFNPQTVIPFALAERTFVSLQVHDVLGRLVRELVGEERPAGLHEVTFDAQQLSSGVYFCTMMAGSFRSVRPMVLLK